MAARVLLAVALLWVGMWFQAPMRALADEAGGAPATAAEQTAQDAAAGAPVDGDAVAVPRMTTTVEVHLDDGSTVSQTVPERPEGQRRAADLDADDAEGGDAADAPAEGDDAQGAGDDAPAEEEAAQDTSAEETRADDADGEESADDVPVEAPDDGESADEGSAPQEPTADDTGAPAEAPEQPGDEDDDAAVAAAAEDPDDVDIEQHYVVEEEAEESASDDDDTVVEEDTDVDVDLDIDGGDGESHTDVVTGGTATVTSGVADAVGNIASQSVTQIALGTATDNGKVFIDQIVIIANIGVAKANSGGNSATGNTTEVTVSGAGGGEHTVEVDGEGSATITTDVALAIGNESVTDITQDMTVVGDGEDASSTQDHYVENFGSATADSGGNTVAGNIQDAANDHQGGGVGSVTHTTDGDATIVTGDAEAIGNLSETTIDQRVDASGRADARVDAIQIANVINFGTAAANTGGNTAVGNDSTSATAQSGGTVDVDANGDASIEAGDATATGNISTTDVSQLAEATASGDAEVYVAQSSIVFNVGAAAANSGFNTALGNVSVTGVGSDGVPNGKTAADLATMMGVDAGSLSQSFWDDWGVTITNVINEVTALLEGTGLYPTAQLQVTEFIIGDPDGAFVRVRQAVLVLDYAVAEATSDGNSATGNATVVEVTVPEGSGAGSGSITIVTDGEAEVVSGDARADANDSVTECEQVATGTSPTVSRTEEGCDDKALPEGPVWGSPAGEPSDPDEEPGDPDEEPGDPGDPGEEPEDPGEEPTEGEPGQEPTEPGERPTDETDVEGGTTTNPGGGGESTDPGDGNPAPGDGSPTAGSDVTGPTAPTTTKTDTAVVLASRPGSGLSSSTRTTRTTGSLASTGSPLAVQVIVAALLIGAGAALVRRRSDRRA